MRWWNSGIFSLNALPICANFLQYYLKEMHEVEANLTSHDITNNCTYDFGEYGAIRIIPFGIVMACACLIGIFGNICIMWILLQKRMRSSNAYFLVALATCDLGIMVCTILLYCVEIWYDQYRIVSMYFAWFTYCKNSKISAEKFFDFKQHFKLRKA